MKSRLAKIKQELDRLKDDYKVEQEIGEYRNLNQRVSQNATFRTDEKEKEFEKDLKNLEAKMEESNFEKKTEEEKKAEAELEEKKTNDDQINYSQQAVGSPPTATLLPTTLLPTLPTTLPTATPLSPPSLPPNSLPPPPPPPSTTTTPTSPTTPTPQKNDPSVNEPAGKFASTSNGDSSPTIPKPPTPNSVFKDTGRQKEVCEWCSIF